MSMYYTRNCQTSVQVINSSLCKTLFITAFINNRLIQRIIPRLHEEAHMKQTYSV